MVSFLRPFRAGDEPALAEICLRTADAGADATGILDDDELWGHVFVLPYVARHPDLAFVVEADDGRVVGYIVGTDDTRAFEEWFHGEWWPRFAQRWPQPAVPLPSAMFGDVYPAHLHIDLLPELQGQGFGRRLIDTLIAELRARGVTGVHLVADARNAGAVAFYPRVGFRRIPAPPGAVAFGLTL